jgi:hypothetical protein
MYSGGKAPLILSPARDVMSRSSHPWAKHLDMKLRCRFVQEEGNKTTIPRLPSPQPSHYNDRATAPSTAKNALLSIGHCVEYRDMN